MNAPKPLKIIDVDRSDKGVFITFRDGRAGLYPTALLDELFPRAISEEELTRGIDDETLI